MISEGLDTLKNMAQDMNEVCLLVLIHLVLRRSIKSYTFYWVQEVDRQVPLMDEIDDKVGYLCHLCNY